MKFFVTGNDSAEKGLTLQLIVPAGSQGSNFTGGGQNLQQSLSVAENVFKLFERGEMTFVLIGFAPDTLFRGTDGDFTKKTFDKNLHALDNYIKLCVDKGTTPVAVILPVAPSAREYYRIFLNPLLNILAQAEKIAGVKVMNFFDLNLSENLFADEVTLTADGAGVISTLLTLELNRAKILSETDFAQMSYDYFYALSHIVPKEVFHAIMDKAFSGTLANLRRKEKIRVAFVTDHAAMWCGDKLYNLFAKNPRFETTVFLCRGPESTLEDIRHDFDQFKSAGVNVIGVFDKNEETPPQDIVFFLRPYIKALSKSFQMHVMTPQTLMINIPYSLDTAPSSDNFGYYNMPLFRLAWKYFFEAKDSLNLLNAKCISGILDGAVSGAPKLDLFLEDVGKVSFPWKMARPDAKKIIWAPHHSFDKKFLEYLKATFPHNFRFMYEFAKAHPEISWVVKPHPRLEKTAVETGLFPSAAAYEDYLQAWNALPNAQVYTGAYYQAIFATSDGMIHDSISFIAEYQYTHKPMIYMLNDSNEYFTELGRKILNVSYLIDGKNLDAIADAIQKIFIEGKDPLKDERRKVFDECLNYYKLNGMSASDFIFKTVEKELGMNHE